MRISRLAIPLLFLALIWLLGVKYTDSRSGAEDDFAVVPVIPRSFSIKVNTVGILDAARSHMVSSAIRGDKGKIIYLVDDGSRVAEGDTLVKLDPTPFEEKVHKLTGEVQMLKATVEASKQILAWEKTQSERAIRSARYNLKVAKLELDRFINGEGPLQLLQYKTDMSKAEEELNKFVMYAADLKKLEGKGYGNRSEVAQAQRKIGELREKYISLQKRYSTYKDHVYPSLEEAARAGIESAQMELEQTRNGSVFTIAKAASNVKESLAKLQNKTSALSQAENELDKVVIRAPFAGIAILFETFREGQKRKPRIGDKVWQNQPLLYLPDITSMVVKTQVREIDLHKIFLGQSCSIKVDAYPNSLLGGEITFIGALASERHEKGAGEKYFQLSVTIKDGDARLRPGMIARVTMLSEEMVNVLPVPVQAVFIEAGQKYCYLQQDRYYLNFA